MKKEITQEKETIFYENITNLIIEKCYDIYKIQSEDGDIIFIHTTIIESMLNIKNNDKYKFIKKNTF